MQGLPPRSHAILLIFVFMGLFFGGCFAIAKTAAPRQSQAPGVRSQPYNNEYLKSAQALEQALRENPNATNRKEVEANIKRFRKLHTMMLESDRNQRLRK